MTSVTTPVVSRTDDLNVEKSAIFSFVMTASRRVKRAVVNSSETIWEGTKVIGRGVQSCLPSVGYLLLFAAVIALVYLAVYINLLFIQFTFSVSPLLGYLLVGIIAVQLLVVLVGSVAKLMEKFA